MRTFGMGAAGKAATKRSQGRLSVRLNAKLRCPLRTHSAILENISKSGAKLAIEGAPKAGCDIILQWHDTEVFGRVSWVSVTHCGVRFASALSPAILQAALSLDEVAHVPDELDVQGAAAKAWFEGDGRCGFD